MPKQQPDDVPDEQRYPRIGAWYEQQDRSLWGLVDALLAEARMSGTRLAPGEMARISRFIQRGQFGANNYAPGYLADLHQVGRWADGHPAVRDYPLGWAKRCYGRSVPVSDALGLMAQAREPLPEGTTNRDHHLDDLITQWRTPSLDARRPTPKSKASQTLAKLKIAEKYGNNLGTIVGGVEGSLDPEQVDVFVERLVEQQIIERLTAIVARVREPATKPKRRRKATTA